MNSPPPEGLRRVALLDPGDFSPPYDLELASGLRAQGCEVFLIGQAGNSDPTSGEFRHEHFYRPLLLPVLRALPPATNRVAKGICHAFDMFALDKLLDSLGVDILHCQWLPVPLLDRLALRRLRRKRPIVLTVHDTNPYHGAAGSRFMNAGHLSLAGDADGLVVHTESSVRQLVGKGLDPSRIHQIPHGLLGAGDRCSRRHRKPDDRLVILQFGKIKPYKGVDVLLIALAQMPPALRAKLDVRIVGKPYLDTAEFERFAVENGLEETVTFRFDFVDDAELDHLLGESDAIVLPYREIDASGVAMTAIARGLPVLASAVDGFKDLFEDGGGAQLVTPGDSAELANVSTLWAAEPEIVDRLAAAMREKRSSVPTWEEIGRRTLAVYAEARAGWAARETKTRGHELTE